MTKMAAKWPKSIPYLWPKRLKNLTLWGCTYLYSPYKGVPPGGLLLRQRLTFLKVVTCSFLFIRHFEAATLFRSRRSFRRCSSSGVSCMIENKKSRTNMYRRTSANHRTEGKQSGVKLQKPLIHLKKKYRPKIR